MKNLLRGILAVALIVGFALPASAVVINVPAHTGAFANGIEGTDIFEGANARIGMSNQISEPTRLVLNFEGADTDTTTTDEVQRHATENIRFQSSAAIDTAQAKFGSSSLLLTSSNTDGVEIIDNQDDFTFGAGAFTIHGFYRWSETPFNATRVFSSAGGGDAVWQGFGGNQFLFYHTNTQMVFEYWDGATNQILLVAKPSLSANTWYHVAAVNDPDNSTFKTYVAGVALINTTNITITSIGSLKGFVVGSIYTTTSLLNNFQGWIDGFEIVKGAALWAVDFTPPIAATEPLYLTSSPATTGTWTALEAGTLDLSTSRTVILVNGVTQTGASTNVKARYFANGGAASSWLTLDGLQAESDITITNTTESFKVEFQYNSNGNAQSESDAFLAIDYEQTGGAGVDDKLMGGTLGGF